MTTLTYGFKRPDTGDQGASLFQALEDNITRLDAHDHDGTDSAKLTAASVTAITQAISSGSWVATSDGNYRQAIILPGSLNYDEIGIMIKNSSGHFVSAQIEKISTTSYYVYTNDNSTSFTAIYIS